MLAVAVLAAAVHAGEPLAYWHLGSSSSVEPGWDWLNTAPCRAGVRLQVGVVVSARRSKEAEGCLDVTGLRGGSVMIDAPDALFDYSCSEQAGGPRDELQRHSAGSAVALLVPPPL